MYFIRVFSMRVVYVVVLLLTQGVAFGAVPQKCQETCQMQLDSIPLENFKRETILKNAEGGQAILVEIKNNKLFIGGELVTNEEVAALIEEGECGGIRWGRIETLLTLYKLIMARQVPDVLFLYTKCCCHIDLNWLKKKRIPVLVGENCYMYEKESVINFIESCSMSRSFFGNNNWSWEFAFQETMESNNVIPWDEKISKIFWRGCLSDVVGWQELLERRRIRANFDGLGPKNFTPRSYIHYLSIAHPEFLDAGITGEPFRTHIIDISTLKEEASIFEHIHYKYQVVLDGICCTNPGYAWRLLSDCCVLKVNSIIYNWFYTCLEPWVHYVPISSDLSDLHTTFKILEENQEVAREIANRGSEFALTYLKPDDFLDFAAMVLAKYADKQSQAESR